ncbi:hypothetical protein ACC674_38845, partial [Rhizobium ruizarguesonis]
QISRSGGVTSEARGNARVSETLPPFRMLTANGTLVSETGSALPLIPQAGAELTANFDNPPGLDAVQGRAQRLEGAFSVG